ncbi:MAG: hypothetical protein FWF79_07925 [Defluviitaleaceae bacterium]|nr:hypothetical protein [Defluviitaleaceae bacterium]
MITNFTNFTGRSTASATAQNNNGVFRMNNSAGPRRAARRDFMRERMEAKEREAQIREAENQRIQLLNERIHRSGERIHSINQQIAELSEEDAAGNYEQLKELNREVALLQSSITGLTNQIGQIHTARAEREQLAIEREFVRQQQEMEERMRERERVAEESRSYENKTDDELEKAAEQANIRNLTMVSIRKENIRALSRTRANLAAAAQQLRNEANFDMHRQNIANAEIQSFVRQSNAEALEVHNKRVEFAKSSTAPLAIPIWRPMEAGHLFSGNPLTEDTFRGRHLQNLDASVARLSANIMHQVGAMYRDSQNQQEEQLRIYREQASLPDERKNEDESDERNENSIDLRL